jgi:hypothetical protein
MLWTASAASARAETECERSGSSLCSKTFYGTGTCDGKDQLVELADTVGWPASAIVPPWEALPSVIVGVEITLHRPPEQFAYAYAGNAASPNQMLFLGPGAVHGRQFYPAGLGFRLPAKGAPGINHVDLHVSCTRGAYQLFYTLYYALEVVRGTEAR